MLYHSSIRRDLNFDKTQSDRFAPRLRRDRPLSLEITENEINNQLQGKAWKYRYPRHIPQFPTSSHQSAISYQRHSLPTTCRLAISSFKTSEELNFDFNLWQARSDHDEIRQLHLENLRQNLERRLQAAKANQDDYLVNLLKLESQQLEMNV
ncbi:hypothetical protein STA3757_25730 [Stanieria sp. NIES-3757]|nr:hypothetical protein STA3757_25730 [Stanieria sp. NIES-3757]